MTAADPTRSCPAAEVRIPTRRRVVTLDLVAVRRRLDGDPVRLSPPERREAIRQALERGWSTGRTQATLKVSSATVQQAVNEPIALVPVSA